MHNNNESPSHLLATRLPTREPVRLPELVDVAAADDAVTIVFSSPLYFACVYFKSGNR
jgi:hypothetical protein